MDEEGHGSDSITAFSMRLSRLGVSPLAPFPLKRNCIAIVSVPITERLRRARAPQDDLEGERLRAAVLHRLVAEESDPVRIGRFALLRRIGSGGSGVVYAAYDPKLDRRVALKLVRDDAGRTRPQTEARFFREAQAMARLSHPNVLAVHDVAVHGTRTYIVLDLVEGEDLRTLLARTSLPWHDIVNLFAQAGEGLAAAHRAGVVHRDFKPANVMVAGFDDGEAPTRVQVMDFGLATEPDLSETENGPDPEASADPEALEATRRGSTVGTPAYMAPEQRRGEAVDERADQFSFCVALYEALYGHRPFQPDADGTWLQAQRLGPEHPGHDHGVPARIARTLERGLAYDPAHRWPSMQALLETLRPARRRGSFRPLAAALALGLSVGAGMWLVATPDDPGCDTDVRAASLTASPRTDSIRAAFASTEVPYATEAWSQASKTLSDYAQRWSTLHHEACGRSRAGATRDLGHLQLACLERRFAEVEGVLEVLEHADPEVVERAVAAVASLTPVETCIPATDSAPRMPSSEQTRPLRLELARAAGLEHAGRYADARRRALEVLSLADDQPSVRAEALARLGSIAARVGDYTDAEHRLSQATWLAETHRLEQVAAEATTLAVWVVGARLQRDDEGRLWAAHADAAVARLGDPPLLRARLESNLGVLDRIAGRHASARDRHQAALAWHLEVLGPDHPEVATAHKELGNALYEWGDAEAAHREYTRALEIRRAALGLQHPDVAVVHNNLGNTSVDLQRLDEARTHLERALAIWTASLPATHPNLGMAHHNLANALRQSGEVDAAVLHYTSAIAIASESLGPHHTTLARYHTNLADARIDQGQFEAAADALDAAAEIWTVRSEARHPDLATLHVVRARLATARGHREAAAEHYATAARMRAALFGPTHPMTREAKQAGLALATSPREPPA